MKNAKSSLSRTASTERTENKIPMTTANWGPGSYGMVAALLKRGASSDPGAEARRFDYGPCCFWWGLLGAIPATIYWRSDYRQASVPAGAVPWTLVHKVHFQDSNITEKLRDNVSTVSGVLLQVGKSPRMYGKLCRKSKPNTGRSIPNLLWMNPFRYQGSPRAMTNL